MSTETPVSAEVPAVEPDPAVESDAAAESAIAVEADATPDAPDWSRDMPLITRESRFLYVDVAARRAKQLRRGALPRLAGLAPDPDTGERPVPVAKLERIAMEEVDEGLIAYALPDEEPAAADGA